MKKYLVILFTTLVTSSGIFAQATIVQAHGQLRIEGNKVMDQCDRQVQLRGMSYFWHQWDDSYKYFNPEVVEWLRDDWKVQIVRGAVAVRNGGYLENKELARNLYSLVEIGQEIPPALYQTVAEVLAYIYRLKSNLNRA